MDRLPLGKTCTKCGEWKLFTEFFRDRSKPDGLATTCKVCKLASNKRWDDANTEKRKADSQVWYQANRERILAERKIEYERALQEDEEALRERQREERKHRSPVKQREAKKRWRRANQDKTQAAGAVWRQNNPDYGRNWYVANAKRVKTTVRAWRKANPDVIRHYTKQYTARKRAQTTNGGVTLEAWHEVCASFDFRCVACGAKTALEMDHVVPLSVGGEHQIENVQPLCRSCNARKGVRTIDYR